MQVMFISTLLGTSGALVLVLARDVIPSLMTSNPAVQALAASQLPFLAYAPTPPSSALHPALTAHLLSSRIFPALPPSEIVLPFPDCPCHEIAARLRKSPHIRVILVPVKHKCSHFLVSLQDTSFPAGHARHATLRQP